MGLTKQAMLEEMDRLDRWRERLEALAAERGFVVDGPANGALGDCGMCGDVVEGDVMSEWVDAVEAWSSGPMDPDLESPFQSPPSYCGHCRHVLDKDD